MKKVILRYVQLSRWQSTSLHLWHGAKQEEKGKTLCGLYFSIRDAILSHQVDDQHFSTAQCCKHCQQSQAKYEARIQEAATGVRICNVCREAKPLLSYYGVGGTICRDCSKDIGSQQSQKINGGGTAKDPVKKQEQGYAIHEYQVCDRCGERKDVRGFYIRESKSGNTHRDKVCRLCKREEAREKAAAKRLQGREERLERLLKLPYKARKEVMRLERLEHRLKHTYGLSIDRYNAMFQQQNGLCAICRQLPSENEGLMVDHDHKTGAVRGLLCQSCNFGLGFFRDNSEHLQRAIVYLKRFEWED